MGATRVLLHGVGGDWWITWINIFQILKDYVPSGWLVRGEDDGELMGW